MNESIVSTAETKYNGWTNRETWLVNLWLESDECTYLEVQDILTSFDTEAERADEIRDYVRLLTDLPSTHSSLTSDLLADALDSVDWHEIARANVE